MINSLEVSRHTSLFFQQVLFLMVIPQLWWFDVCGHLWVDVMTVTDVVHPAATARDDALNLLSLVHLGWLVPVYRHRRGEMLLSLKERRKRFWLQVYGLCGQQTTLPAAESARLVSLWEKLEEEQSCV